MILNPEAIWSSGVSGRNGDAIVGGMRISLYVGGESSGMLVHGVNL